MRRTIVAKTYSRSSFSYLKCSLVMRPSREGGRRSVGYALLLALLALTIFRAVDVLEPSRRVVADGLNLGRRTAGYVNVAPGWRYLKILYALENRFLAY